MEFLPAGAEGIQKALMQMQEGLALSQNQVMTLQNNLDLLIPGLVPLLLTFFCMWLLRKKVSPIIIILALFLVGVTGHVIGLL